QAALTRLGSNVIRTSRVMLPVCPRRATLASLHPWRGAFTGWHTLEWCPEKAVPVPGSQLCSWNTCRELYRQVGNFVGSVSTDPCGVPASVGRRSPLSTTPAFSQALIC